MSDSTDTTMLVKPFTNCGSQFQPWSSHDLSTPASSSSGRKRSRSRSIEDQQVLPGMDGTGLNVSGSPWKGWAELENDPLIFTQLLRDWGVSNVNVDEVIPLDAIFEKQAGSVLGLIFLSRWTPSESNDNVAQPPQELWFANQVSTYSCATLALMNIINNRPDLDLGTQLNVFKQSTSTMSSKDRGFALDDLQFVKDIHNSFSREIDHMVVDLRLKEDFQADKKKRAPQKKKKRRKKVVQKDDDDNGFHFIAYVPSGGQVWKLDGTEALPRRLGNYHTAGEWLRLSVADIQAQMEDPEASAMEFSCLSVAYEAEVSTVNADEVRIQRMKEDWSPFIAHMLELRAEKGDIESLLE